MDWKKLKAEYIAGGTSYRKLAEKYEVKLSALRSVAERENWVELKAQAQHKTDTKLVESVSTQEADKAKKILDATDKLLDRIVVLIDHVDNPTGIKDITTALKNIKDIKGIKSEVDLREQEARIAKLQKEAASEEKDSNEIKVVIGSEAEDYSK